MDLDKLIAEVAARVMRESEALASPVQDISGGDVARNLEIALMDPAFDEEAVHNGCAGARHLKLAAVCVPPYYARAAGDFLAGSGVETCAVIGFPNGAMSGEAKIADARVALRGGVDRIDAFLNIAALRSGCSGDAAEEIAALVDAVHARARLRIILPVGLLSESELGTALVMVRKSGALGAKLCYEHTASLPLAEEISAARKLLGSGMELAVACGVDDIRTAVRLTQAGADRICNACAIALAEDAKDR